MDTKMEVDYSGSGNYSRNAETNCSEMKNLISAIDEYLVNRTEDSAVKINKTLQAYSLTINHTLFNPDTNVGAEFFLRLHELCSKVDPHSQMAWYCVDVLSNACHNFSARQALMGRYHFLPPISRFLGDQLTTTKKKKLLRLLLDLSCGIKISWQIPHLSHLMTTLTKWVDNRDEEIVQLSLGVLVNLCYKNLPAVYTLSRCVDVKKFLRFCLPLPGPIIEVYVCKLMIILDYMNGDLPPKTALKLIHQSFLSILEAFRNSDIILLRQIVDFFLDIVSQSKDRAVFRDYGDYSNQVNTLLQLIGNKSTMDGSGEHPMATNTSEPECVDLILEFVHCLIVHKINPLTDLHQDLVKVALQWVHSEAVSYHALALLRTVADCEPAGRDAVPRQLVAALPAFLVVLQSDDWAASMAGCRRMAALLQLLRCLLQNKASAQRLLAQLRQEDVRRLFARVTEGGGGAQPREEQLPWLEARDAGTRATDAVDTYLHALGLVRDLAQLDGSWAGLWATLLQHRRVHMVVAQAMYGGQPDSKVLAMEMAAGPLFPRAKVAQAMQALQASFPEAGPAAGATAGQMAFSTLSFAQTEKLDETLDLLRARLSSDHLVSTSTSQVMELYEYKIASLVHAERMAQNNIEMASQSITHLQHRLAKQMAEQNKQHQMMFHTEQCLEETNKSYKELKELYAVEKTQLLAVTGRLKVTESQVKMKDKEIRDYQAKLEDSKTSLKEMTELKDELEKKVAKCEGTIKKLVESGNRAEKQAQKKEEMLQKAHADIANLNMQIQKLEQVQSSMELKLAEVTKQYQASKAIIDTITRVASSQVP